MPEDELQQVAFLLPESLREALRDAGYQDRRSQSDIAREALTAWLEERKAGLDDK